MIITAWGYTGGPIRIRLMDYPMYVMTGSGIRNMQIMTALQNLKWRHLYLPFHWPGSIPVMSPMLTGPLSCSGPGSWIQAQG